MYHHLSEHFALHATSLIAYACIGLMEPNRELFLLDAGKCGFGCALAILRDVGRTGSVADSAGGGIPTSRILSIRLANNSLSIEQCPRGIPSETWILIHQESEWYFRGFGRK